MSANRYTLRKLRQSQSLVCIRALFLLAFRAPFCRRMRRRRRRVPNQVRRFERLVQDVQKITHAPTDRTVRPTASRVARARRVCADWMEVTDHFQRFLTSMHNMQMRLFSFYSIFADLCIKYSCSSARTSVIENALHTVRVLSLISLRKPTCPNDVWKGLLTSPDVLIGQIYNEYDFFNRRARRREEL
jgi:hypothetical protein